MRTHDRDEIARPPGDLHHGFVQEFLRLIERLVDPLHDLAPLRLARDDHKRHSHRAEHRQKPQHNQQQHASAAEGSIEIIES